MRQKEIEKKQREILFDHFKAGTLKRKMDTAYGEEETAETAKPAEPVEAAETTESAKSAKSAEPAEPARYDYQFDFKYLLAITILPIKIGIVTIKCGKNSLKAKR